MSLGQEISLHSWTKLAKDLFHFKGTSYLLIVDYTSRFPVVCNVKVQKCVLSVKVQNVWYGRMLCYYQSYDPAVDNSDSPSIVEQLQQGCNSDCYTFISDCFLVL